MRESSLHFTRHVNSSNVDLQLAMFMYTLQSTVKGVSFSDLDDKFLWSSSKFLQSDLELSSRYARELIYNILAKISTARIKEFFECKPFSDQ